MIKTIHRAMASAAVILLAGCAVGPDFQKPAAPATSSYTRQPIAATAPSPGVAGGEAQALRSGADITADWWTLFHSPALNSLITQALANNPDLKAAQAALRSAHENTAAQRGAYYPKLSAGFTASREQDPPGALAPVPADNSFLYNLYTPQLSISYVPDVWGLNQRTVESLAAQQEGVRYQLMATYNTLVSNVVVAAIQLTATQDQVATTRTLIDLNTRMKDQVSYQFQKGYASRLDLATQETQLAQTVASLPPLLKQEAQYQHQLAVLVGKLPSEAEPQNFQLASMTLPTDVPLSLPSALVEQRPDVLQAQANMHSASALIGVALANRLPNITLSANAGSTALAMNQLFSSGTGFWNIAGSLTATIFDANTLLHQEKAARENYTQAAEQYRSTVLTAFQNVADSLVALKQDADALKATADAEKAAKLSLDLAQEQTGRGYISQLQLLNSEQAYQQAVIALSQAQASRFTDTAALFQALGGGWWNRPELARNDDEK